MFVKAYFYVSTSGIVSQSVWALGRKTSAALASSHDSAIHRINIQAWALSSSCELSQNIASPPSFSPTRTLAARPPLAPLYYRELCTGIFVVYSAIIFCSFLAMYCMLPLLYFIARVVFITQILGDVRSVWVYVRCGIFYAKILPKIVDTSSFLPYHKGSF